MNFKAKSIVSFFSKLMVFCLLFLSIFACEEPKANKNSGKNKSNMLQSRGAIAEILVVMDSTRWKGLIGEALREVMMSPYPGLPQDEPIFSLAHVKPRDFSRFLKRHNNIIFLTSLSDNSPSGQRMKAFFTKTSLDMVVKDESKFMFFKENEYAYGQKLMYLFGKTDEKLIDNIIKNGDKLIEFFLTAERKRMQNRIFGEEGEKEQVKLQNFVRKNTGLDAKIPQGYEVAKSIKGFTWLRKPGEPVDKSILITSQPYSSVELFDTSQVVQWRETFGFKHMNDKSLKNSYMSTQNDIIPLEFKKLSLNQEYTMEYRGLWKLKNKTRGGPFIAYAFIDKKRNLFYYIEGLVYAPSIDKRNAMMEMEAILRTFKISEEKNL